MTAAKSNPKAKGSKRGDNYTQEQLDEIRKCAKAQLKLDKEKNEQQSDWRETHKGITGRLKSAGVSRQAFDQPYKNFKREQEADEPEEAKKTNTVYIAEQLTCYQALSPDGERNWKSIFTEAEKINAARAKAAEEATDSGERGGNDDDKSGGDESPSKPGTSGGPTVAESTARH